MADSEQPQNIYDDPQFFDGYSQLDRFRAAWGRGMEHDAFMKLMGDVSGRLTLDLGCGAGHLAFYLAENGAAEVVGIDLSERMLEVARAERAHPRITYRREAMEQLDFPAESFDLVASSLAFHYVRDYAGLVARVARWLAPGGALVFSTEHPIYTARVSASGWVRGSEGTERVWGIDRYAEEGPREHEWFGAGVRRYHRTISTLLNGLIDAGLTIERVLEPVPGEAWLRERPDDVDEARRPIFLLIRAVKPSSR